MKEVFQKLETEYQQNWAEVSTMALVLLCWAQIYNARDTKNKQKNTAVLWLHNKVKLWHKTKCEPTFIEREQQK